MILIVPSVVIKNGKCVHKVKALNSACSIDDPVEMAKLWRKENAKFLHITDSNGILCGHPTNLDVVEKIAHAIDIPIELGGGLQNFDDIKRAFDVGVYRVIVGTIFINKPEETKLVLNKFGANHVVLGIDAQDGIIRMKDRQSKSELSAINLALNAKEIGFQRIIYTDIVNDSVVRSPNFRAIKLLAEKVNMKITVSGGVLGIEDLLKLQEMESLGIDSVVVGRALYENKFSCQALWRICEAGNYPYTARI